jgi:hypothetical protein
MPEILKPQFLEAADPPQFVGPLHRLQPEKPGVEMKLRQ